MMGNKTGLFIKRKNKKSFAMECEESSFTLHCLVTCKLLWYNGVNLVGNNPEVVPPKAEEGVKNVYH